MVAAATPPVVRPIQVIVFHRNAHRHVDDAACLWIARTRPEAEARFPGISTAMIIFDGTGGEDFEGMSGDELEKEGILMFGVGGGRFDEHPGSHNKGKKGKCSFVLFCEEIGIADDPALKRIIKYVTETDQGRSGHYANLGSLAKIIQYDFEDPTKDSPEEPSEETIRESFNWQIRALNALYIRQLRFLKVEEDYGRASKRWVEDPYGNKILIVSVESPSRLMNDFARSKGASIVIQKRPLDCKVMPGNIMVFTHSKARLGLAGVAEAIRQEEQRADGVPVETDHQKLRAPGKMAGAMTWFYLDGPMSEMLLNGSDSAPKTPATKLALQTVTDLVADNLEKVSRR